MGREDGPKLFGKALRSNAKITWTKTMKLDQSTFNYENFFYHFDLSWGTNHLFYFLLSLSPTPRFCGISNRAMLD